MQFDLTTPTADLIVALQHGGTEAVEARKVMRTHAKNATLLHTAVPRIATKAAKVLQTEHGMHVSVAELTKFGFDLITEQARLTDGKHPSTRTARAFFKAILLDMMIERAMAH
jgi:hypothetical protein